MPVPLLEVHLVMLPRLRAEESFLTAERIAVGTGAMKKGDRADVTAAWRRAGHLGKVRRPADLEGARALAAAAGIGVRLVPIAKRRAKPPR